jgi:hypothetical protein
MRGGIGRQNIIVGTTCQSEHHCRNTIIVGTTCTPSSQYQCSSSKYSSTCSTVIVLVVVVLYSEFCKAHVYSASQSSLQSTTSERVSQSVQQVTGSTVLTSPPCLRKIHTSSMVSKLSTTSPVLPERALRLITVFSKSHILLVSTPSL